MSERTRYGISRDGLHDLLESWGEPRFRTDQVWAGIHSARRLEDCTDLPTALRSRLAAELPESLRALTIAHGDDGMTQKWLWAAGDDGAEIETVLMRYPDRATVCVSSQAGCAMGCTFCATGQAGFDRHLDVGEIVEQVVRATRAVPERVDHVVFMGMGEPLANYDATVDAVRRLHDDVGISARSITVSTVGVVPGIVRLADEHLPVTLAVSLHAPADEQRDLLVPLNRRYPIAEVLEAAETYQRATGRRVSFEYAVIAGVNDDLEQAAILAGLLGDLGPPAVHVNLIPLNPTCDYRGHAPNRARMDTFARRLRAAGLHATVRRNRGTDIDAACGQLRSRHVELRR